MANGGIVDGNKVDSRGAIAYLIIEAYLKKNPGVTYNTFEGVFSKLKAQNHVPFCGDNRYRSSFIIKKDDYAKHQKEIGKNGTEKPIRFYTQKSFNVEGIDYYVSNQWGDNKDKTAKTLKPMADYAKENLSMEISYDETVRGQRNANSTVSSTSGKIVVADYKNLIIYGIPGCGKSYKLQEDYLNSFNVDNIVRTTFHPEYSNTDFVGQVRPVKNGLNLDYEFIPGPFTKALELAFSNEKVALVIEEINRGNAAAIFGDIFQLLDRDSKGDSEYKIDNKNICDYLSKKGFKGNKIYIPGNLYIYATMNTSDQNVFKLDTAFKRRWEYERLTNEDTKKYIKDFIVFNDGTKDISWSIFIEKINDIIKNNDDISGDRQIGNFFYQGIDKDLKRFANKVLEYIYNDICKYGGKDDIFDVNKYKSFDDIYNGFINGENVFKDKLFD